MSFRLLFAGAAAPRRAPAMLAGLSSRRPVVLRGVRCYADATTPEASDAKVPEAPEAPDVKVAEASDAAAPKASAVATAETTRAKKRKTSGTKNTFAPRSQTPQKQPEPFRRRVRGDFLQSIGSSEALQMANARAADEEPWLDFTNRHIGPREEDIDEMLKVLGPGAETLDSFVSQVIPEDVMQPPKVMVKAPKIPEYKLDKEYASMHVENRQLLWMNGGGYYPAGTPSVIKRNLLENPGWYTSYTPYQAEVSQGRLESLLNFQTMVSDLTGLPVANASLLDEGTAAAEAMSMSLANLSSERAKRPGKTYLVSNRIHRHCFSVLLTRASGFGINVKLADLTDPGIYKQMQDLGDDLVGVLAQYPDAEGGVDDFRQLAKAAHEQGVLFSVGTDLLSLTILTPPGEWGADIAYGNTQRFGVPLGFGGPHAAFMSVKESIKRRLPGRLVGVSRDRTGRPALRLALQTREQHIRREKATSNVCTAQALLANMAAMYAIYHGPSSLKKMAYLNLRTARMLQRAAEHYGLEILTRTLDPKGRVLFDTIAVSLPTPEAATILRSQLEKAGVSPGKTGRDQPSVVLAVPKMLRPRMYLGIVSAFQHVATKNVGDKFTDVGREIWVELVGASQEQVLQEIPDAVRRQSSYLTHPVFNSHQSETELLRYMNHLQSKDISLVHSMIPLGSCTMKLNGTSQMQLIGHYKANTHPLSPRRYSDGFRVLSNELGKQLAAMTGMDTTSLQPNSGAQGEFAGLRAIRQYHEENGDHGGVKRDICLIPVSAHGTNPASASMAGMRVVPVKCEPQTGNLDLQDLEDKCKLHREQLGAIMVTYPSTFGVFEPHIRKICDMVHEHGGLVYMDGANMNAQIGLTSPGALGADVCHLNLHKTFCIPHGGGGPGVGPVCAKKRLAKYLPGFNNQLPVTSAQLGSASILAISWAYIRTMGTDGLRKATQVALLNANYLLARLQDHYPILYTNDKGRCAHEFILDARPFKASSGIEAVDIAKRLQDYGFHAPTMSWPVPNTLMIEPTESESKAELDRYIDALISIRQEIRDIEEGRQPREGNVLKNAPHTQADLVKGDGEGKWDRPYSREQAAYPLPYLLEKKFWPSVTRVDDTYGDTNIFCTCPPVEDTTDL